MAGDARIELELSGFDRPQSMDAATGGVHLTGQHPVAGAGGQAEPAVDAWVGRAGGKSRQVHRDALIRPGGLSHAASLTEHFRF